MAEPYFERVTEEYFEQNWLPETFDHSVRSFKEECDLENAAATYFTASVSANLKTRDDVKKWIDELSEVTHTNWIVGSTVKHTSAASDGIFNYQCHQSSRNKRQPNSERNKSCPARIHFRIRKTTKRTLENPDVRKGLLCLISIKFVHSHSIQDFQTLRLRRMNEKTRNAFMGYFEGGMNASQAFLHHKSLIEMENDYSEAAYADASLNPTHRMVTHVFQKWRKQEPEPRSGFAAGVLQNPEQKLPQFTAKRATHKNKKFEATAQSAELEETLKSGHTENERTQLVQLRARLLASFQKTLKMANCCTNPETLRVVAQKVKEIEQLMKRLSSGNIGSLQRINNRPSNKLAEQVRKRRATEELIAAPKKTVTNKRDTYVCNGSTYQKKKINVKMSRHWI